MAKRASREESALLKQVMQELDQAIQCPVSIDELGNLRARIKTVFAKAAKKPQINPTYPGQDLKDLILTTGENVTWHFYQQCCDSIVFWLSSVMIQRDELVLLTRAFSNWHTETQHLIDTSKRMIEIACGFDCTIEKMKPCPPPQDRCRDFSRYISFHIKEPFDKVVVFHAKDAKSDFSLEFY